MCGLQWGSTRVWPKGEERWIKEGDMNWLEGEGS